MATIEVRDTDLVVHLRGWDKLLALRGSLTIPLLHVESVRAQPKEAHFDDMIRERWRGFGTYVPGRVCIGSVQLPTGRAFYDVRDPSRAVAIDIVGEAWQLIVVEVDDETPEHAMTRITNALDAHGHTRRRGSRPSANGDGPSPAPGRLPVVVVGVDLGPHSAALLKSAAMLVRVHEGAELHAVHVRHLPTPDGTTESSTGVTADSAAVLDAALDSELRSVCKRALPTGAFQVSTHILAGERASKIAEFARSVHADIIVLEARGRNGVAPVAEGSVVSQIAHEASCSVLTVQVKAPGERASKAKSVSSTKGV